MRTIKYISFLKMFGIVLPILFLLISCKEKGTEPPTFQPGKRNYVWTIDSLRYADSYQTLMYDIWASSPSDVYVVGHNEITSYGVMYRYDGKYWRDVKLHTSQGGKINAGFSLRAIHGFSSDNIYAVGDKLGINDSTQELTHSSLIIHFDGSSWSEMAIERKEDLICIAGYPPNKIWAGGYSGTIYYYDGTKFTIYKLDREYYVRSIACLSPTEIYAIADIRDVRFPIDSTGHYLLKFKDSTWQVIDSVMEIPNSKPAHFGANLYTDYKTLYAAGSNLYKYSGEQWIKLLDAQVGYFSKTGDNNIFAVGLNTYHFNGIDWVTLTPSEKYKGGCDVFAVGGEVFIINQDVMSVPQKTIVLHGE